MSDQSEGSAPTDTSPNFFPTLLHFLKNHAIVKHMLNYTPSLDGVFHSLADPTRRQIVERLTLKSASVKELAEPFDMSLPAVMLHLQILEAAGIVTSRKEGRVRTVTINPEPLLMAEAWISQRKQMWNQMFDQLEDFLDAEEEETK